MQQTRERLSVIQRPLALIVDHGLRVESAVEAASVAVQAQGFGMQV